MRRCGIAFVAAVVAATRAAYAQPGGELESPDVWRDFVERLSTAGEVVVQEAAPSSPADRAEGYGYLSRLLATALDKAVLRADPDDPQIRWSRDTWGLPNSDALYTTVPVRGDAVYRLRGRRGSVHWLNLQVTAGWFDSDVPMRVVSQVDADDLEIAEDGTFTVILGGEERPGNWLPFEPDVSMLTIRQFFYDWEREERAALQIERVGPPRVPPRLDPEQVRSQLQAAADFVDTTAALFVERALATRGRATNQFVEPYRASDQLGIQRNVYTSGHFVLGPDEALILEVRPPSCFYWGIQLGNFWMEPLDYANHQSSLNGHQAVLDPDGVFRAVVSQRDPGVSNWLDTAGRSEGAMLIRWLRCDAAAHPSTRLVRFDEVLEVLPESTKRVTPEERAAALSRRRDHVERRYR